MTFSGTAGKLEGLWRPPKPGTGAQGVVVVAHPHPAEGGTMANKVVFHTARVLNHDLDYASFRFNFRGVGASEGTYDEGRGEVADVEAAWQEAVRRAPGVPLVGAGFSFGAAMTLIAASRRGENRIEPAALALIGVPARIIPLPDPFPVAIPLVAVHGEEDRFTPPEVIGRYLESWPGPVAFRVEPGADHFLEGHLVPGISFLRRNLKYWLQA